MKKEQFLEILKEKIQERKPLEVKKELDKEIIAYIQNEDIFEDIKKILVDEFAYEFAYEFEKILYSIDIEKYFYENTYKDAFDKLNDYILDDIYRYEAFVYYGDAIDYLAKNDPSLLDSITLANKMGFSIDNLDSCFLANILYQDNMLEKYYKLQDDLLEFLKYSYEILKEIDYLVADIIESYL